MLGHANNYNRLGQEGFDMLCEHLHSKRIGWLSADLLRKQTCRVSLKPKYQHLMGDANGCAVDYPPDQVQFDSPTNSKNSGISWADNDASKKSPTELGIIFLRNPNIPNSEVFPPQLKGEKNGRFVTVFSVNAHSTTSFSPHMASNKRMVKRAPA